MSHIAGIWVLYEPKFDIAPHDDRTSRIASCLEAAHHFLLSAAEAILIVEAQLRCIGENWPGVCEEAALGEADRNLFWGLQFISPFACTALRGDAAGLKALADDIRGTG